MPDKVVWRIATDAPDYEADDLTGAGAKRTGGRWNETGTPMLYTSESRALACLETMVHLNAGGLPLNRYLVRLEFSDAAWKAATSVDPGNLIGWDADPPGRASIRHGTEWVRAKSSLLLQVPSVIVPEEHNFLVNPLHPEISGVTVTKVRKWTYEPRLVPAA